MILSTCIADMCTRNHWWIAFSILIGTHEILSMSSTVLKLNYSVSFVLSSTLITVQWVRVQLWRQTHSIRNMFDTCAYSFTFIDLEILIILINDSNGLNHSSKFSVLVVAAFRKKRRKNKTKTVSKASTQPSTEYCSVRIILIISYRIILILWFL